MNAIAIPCTPHSYKPRRLGLPSVVSVPSVVKNETCEISQSDAPPEPAIIELIYHKTFGSLCAILIPKEITQDQMITAGAIARHWFEQQPELAQAWGQWRVYAPKQWADNYRPYINQNKPRPSGAKIAIL